MSAVRYTKSSSEQQRSVYFVNFKDYRIDQWYQMIKPADTYLTGLHFCAFIGVNLCHSNANHKHIAHWSLETDFTPNKVSPFISDQMCQWMTAHSKSVRKRQIKKYTIVLHLALMVHCLKLWTLGIMWGVHDYPQNPSYESSVLCYPKARSRSSKIG